MSQMSEMALERIADALENLVSVMTEIKGLLEAEEPDDDPLALEPQ